MAKTAFELSREEWKAYHPDRNLSRLLDPERERRAWEVAHAVARLLREEFGALRVAVFGSLAKGRFAKWSDIDLAVWGISPGQYFRASARADSLCSGFAVDIVDPENCSARLRQHIEEEGVEL